MNQRTRELVHSRTDRAGKGNHRWRTPLEFFRALDNQFHFLLDPCTEADNHLGTQFIYTENENGLNQAWMDSTFVNPPYDDVTKWIEKALLESQSGRATVVMLLPSRTGVRWYHDYLCSCKGKPQINGSTCTGNRPEVTVAKLAKRLRFYDPVTAKNDPAPFDSLVVVFWKKTQPQPQQQQQQEQEQQEEKVVAATVEEGSNGS